MPQSFFDKAYLKVVFDRNSPGKVQPDAVILKNDDSSLSIECESVKVARYEGSSGSIFFYFKAHFALNLVVKWYKCLEFISLALFLEIQILLIR